MIQALFFRLFSLAWVYYIKTLRVITMKLSFRLLALSRLVLGLLLVAGALPAAASASAQTAVQEIVLQVDTPSYQWDKTGLSVPGYAALRTPGAPILPMWTTVVELPAGGEWMLTSQPGPAVKLGIEGALPAAPTARLDLNGPTPWQQRTDLPQAVPEVVTPNPAIYAQNAFYPAELVQAGPEQWQNGRRLLAVRAMPFQVNPAQGQALFYPSIRIVITVRGSDRSARPVVGLPATARGPEVIDGAVTIRTQARGLYRLTYTDLQGAGAPVASLDPATLAMTYLNQPVDIQVTGAADGRFDPGDLVLFYALPYEGRYMTQNVYRLTYGGSAGARMTTRATTPNAADPLISTMNQTVRIERDRDYRSLYDLPKDVDHWFDTAVYANAASPTASATYSFEGSAALATPAAGTATVRASLHGGVAQAASPDQSVEVLLNSHSLGIFPWEGSVPYLVAQQVSTDWLDQTPNRIVLKTALTQLPGVTAYWVSPDWVEITYPTALQAVSDRLYAEAVPTTDLRARFHATGFTGSGIQVYDVRDPRHPVQLTTTQEASSAGGWAVDFWDEWAASAPAPSYYLVRESGLLQPASVVQDTPSTLLSDANTADYIAIVHASLSIAVQPLLDRRAAQGYRVKKVDVQDIYDEVSGGRVDPEAIRTFLTYAYDHWNTGGPRPAYVLLVGDGHFDFKNAAGTNLPNLIPPYLLNIDPFLGETAADNRYVSIDGPDDFLPDMHLGRIPAKTPADVSAYVNKVAAYESAAGGAWQRQTIFVADDKDNSAGNFHQYSDHVRLNWLPPSFPSETIYYRLNSTLDTGPKMRTAIKAAFNNGTVYLQWFGHASQFRWGSVSMFDILDPATLAANDRMPFTVHYGCWSGYFIGITGSVLYNRNEQSLGEVLVLTPGRGSVVDLSPTGLHIGSALLSMNEGVVKAIFQDRIVRTSNAVDAGRLYFYQNSSVAFYDLIDTLVLLGDPALELRVAFESHGLYLPLVQVQ